MEKGRHRLIISAVVIGVLAIIAVVSLVYFSQQVRIAMFPDDNVQFEKRARLLFGERMECVSIGSSLGCELFVSRWNASHARRLLRSHLNDPEFGKFRIVDGPAGTDSSPSPPPPAPNDP